MNIQLARVGTFFFFIGLILIIIYFASDPSQSPPVGYFFAGVASGGLGIYLISRNRKPPTPAGRFRLFKKFNKPKEQPRK